MGTRYDHLTLEERCRLRGLMEMELGISEIARRLGRHRGTIHREIARNRCVDGYRPDSAARTIPAGVRPRAGRFVLAAVVERR